MKRLLHLGVVAAVVGALTVMAPTAASAANNQGDSPRLSFFNCTNVPQGFLDAFGVAPPPCDPANPGSVAWVRMADSDRDGYALRFVTGAPTGDTSFPVAGVTVLNTTVTHELVSNVQALRMDSKLASDTGMMSIVLVLTLDTGDAILTGPLACQTQLLANGWVRSDFRNDPTNDCSLSRLESGTFVGDGTQSAWDKMVLSFGSSVPRITGAYLFQGGSAMTNYFDRLTFDRTVFTVGQNAQGNQN